MDPGDGSIILDWITENPSTMSEAAGRGVKDWSFFLTNKSHREVFGVNYLGSSSNLSYRYVQPKTTNSSFFSEFLDDCSISLAGVPPPALDVVTSEFVPPSEDDLYKHIQGFGDHRPDATHLSNVTFAGLFRELCDVEGWGLKLSGLLNPRSLSKLTVPAKTSPGIRWKKMGYRTKREALMPALLEATRSINKLIEEGVGYDAPPCGVAGRGKRQDMNRGEDSLRKDGRLIVMPDLVRHLMGSLGSAPYMGALKQLDKSRGGVLLGMGPFSESYKNIADWCQGATSFLFLDFKKFDQSVPSRLLSYVMKHISSRFESGPGTSEYWKCEFEHLVRTKIAMPDGAVFQKERGVASGDPWTSLAGSYSNWVVLRWVCDRLGLDAKIWTFGDDSVVAVYNKKVEQLSVARFADMAYKGFGMTVSTDKSYVSSTLVDIEPEPEPMQSGSFLSMHFLATPMGVRPTRGIQDLYELMLVPERNPNDVGWEVVRTAMAYLSFYYNDNARYVLEEYWDWLHKRHKIPELTGTARDLALLREMDIPWSSFKWEWLNRLPRPGEVELLYKYGHTGFYPPLLWGAWYHKLDGDPLGNVVSFADTGQPW